MFKEHGHYYGAFFAILEAERGYDHSRNPAFTKLKTRRVTSGVNSTILMANLEMVGHDFETLKKEMDSAFQRKKREEGTYLSNALVLYFFVPRPLVIISTLIHSY